jgi:hypothetical protein
LLKKLNPEYKIIGLYGGPRNKKLPQDLLDELDGNYVLPFRSKKFKWMHGDLCIRQWFVDEGHKLDFDAVNLVEWDSVFLEPFDELYKIPANVFGVAKRRTHEYMLQINWHWITDYFRKMEWEKQIEEAKRLLGRDFNTKDFYFSILGGIQIPRAFLVEYAKINPKPLTNDEARICLYAQSLGFKIEDIGLRDDNNLFVATGYPALNDDMFVEKARQGAAALHPVRTVSLMKKILSNRN